jgi:hypothetical protein
MTPDRWISIMLDTENSKHPLTRQVHEGEIRDIGSADLKAHTVLREGQLAFLQVIVLALEELLGWGARVQYGALSAADTLLDVGLVGDRVSEPFGTRLAEGSTRIVGDTTNRDDAPPCPLRV